LALALPFEPLRNLFFRLGSTKLVGLQLLLGLALLLQKELDISVFSDFLLAAVRLLVLIDGISSTRKDFGVLVLPAILPIPLNRLLRGVNPLTSGNIPDD